MNFNLVVLFDQVLGAESYSVTLERTAGNEQKVIGQPSDPSEKVTATFDVSNIQEGETVIAKIKTLKDGKESEEISLTKEYKAEKPLPPSNVEIKIFEMHTSTVNPPPM